MAALKVEPPHIDGYRYTRHLGSGGYSEVFAYEELQLGREVAVKVLTHGTSEDEARVMAQLGTHTHIVDVYRVGETETGLAYIVMQLYSGPNFAQRLQSGSLTVAEVLQLGVQLCGALEWAHRLHVLHRDIKPANILTSETGRPGLADFGIAASGEERGEQTGVSLPWVPPEVLEGNPPDELSDIYSLAATLYTLLEGVPPFVAHGKENTDQAVVRRTLTEPPPPLRRTDAPPTLVSLLRSGLSKSPAARPSTAEAFGRALQGVEAELRLAQTPLEVAVAAAAPVVDRTTEDATRVRGVRVINANPVDAHTRARVDAGTRVRRTHGAEMISVPADPRPALGTARRRMVSGPELPVPEPRVADEPLQPQGSRSRGRAALIGGVLAVIAAIVVVAFVGGGGRNPEEDDPDVPFASEAPLVESVLPVSNLRIERVDSQTARAVWTAPEGVQEFVWRRCELGSQPTGEVTTATEVSFPLAEGQTACVAVIAQKEGATSEERTAEGPKSTTGAP